MDNIVIIKANKKKNFLLFFASVIFTSAGAFMVSRGDETAWGGVVFFGFCLLFSLYMLFPNVIEIKIDRNGMEIKLPFKFMKYTWEDIDGFYVKDVLPGLSATKFVAIIFSERYKENQRSQNKYLVNIKEEVIPNHFSKPTEELCVYLNSLKNQCKDSRKK